jgi:hypothetical protein
MPLVEPWLMKRAIGVWLISNEKMATGTIWTNLTHQATSPSLVALPGLPPPSLTWRSLKLES